MRDAFWFRAEALKDAFVEARIIVKRMKRHNRKTRLAETLFALYDKTHGGRLHDAITAYLF
jgi:hypothetical protein